MTSEKTLQNQFKKGFTIVELLVVIVVIGILASVTLVAYGQWRKQAVSASLKSDLSSAAAAMENYRNFNTGYPSTIPTTFTPSTDTNLSMAANDGTTFCITATSKSQTGISFYINSDNKSTGAVAGTC